MPKFSFLLLALMPHSEFRQICAHEIRLVPTPVPSVVIAC